MPDVFNRHGFGPSVAVKQPSSCSWVDHLRFGSTTSDWVALLGLAFASPPFQKNLGSPLIVTRRLIKQKARHHQLAPALTPCKHIISGTISLRSQRFFSPFPRGTCSLSVANEYLGLRRGRRRFIRSFTCIVFHRNSSRCYPAQVIPFGNLRVKACLPLSVAYRSLPRPSSPIGTKASMMRSL